MSDKRLSFLDLNVVIYAYDSSGGQKQSIAQKMLTDGLRDETTVISPQVLGEFFFSPSTGRKFYQLMRERRLFWHRVQ